MGPLIDQLVLVAGKVAEPGEVAGRHQPWLAQPTARYLSSELETDS